MKVVIVKERVIEGLQKAASILPAKTGAAYLRSIWLRAEGETLSLLSTDANIEFSGSYPAMIAEEGLVGVQGKAFVDLMRQLPAGEIVLTLEADGSTLLLEQGRRSYRLPANDAAWFQNFSPFPEEGAVVWSGDFLQDLLERVSFCIDDDDDRDAISCLYMGPRGNGRIEVCGLNGHQFALSAFTHDDLAALLPEKGVLIQKKYILDLKKWLGSDEIELNIADKRLHLRTLDRRETLSLPRAAHDYPDYSVFMGRLDDAGSTRLNVDRKEAVDALGRVAIFNTESDRCAYLDLAPQETVLSAQGQDVGSASESLEATCTGDLTRIAFPTRNLMDIMGHFTSPRLDLTFTGQEGPCGVTGAEDPDYTVIIMPMKIAQKEYFDEEEK